MEKPATYKPWIDGRGQPVCVSDPDGHFVTLADYQALEQRLNSSVGHRIETLIDSKPDQTPEDADGQAKS